jgi:tricorn protease
MGDSRISHSPRISPDGRWIGFVSGEEGTPEVYVMPAEGGPARRLTWQGTRCRAVGFTPDSSRMIYASTARTPHARERFLWSVSIDGGATERLPVGPADRIGYGPSGARVIGRNIGDPAHWKRYRGGTSGDLWVDAAGDGDFRRLLSLEGNLADPMWVGERIYFLSDHEGHGNLYSCTPSGDDLRRHTSHETFYARAASTDGARIVYQCGGSIHLFDPQRSAAAPLHVRVASARPQQRRRFVAPADYLENAVLHPKGHSLLLNIRGKVFRMGGWEGAVSQLGERDAGRYRLPSWLAGGDRFVAIVDAGAEEAIEVHSLADPLERTRQDALDIGRPHALWPSPTRAALALVNQRLELLHVDLDAGTVSVVDHSAYARIGGVSWSPDGRLLAYAFPDSLATSHIRVADLEANHVHVVTDSVHLDVATCFDPEGRYLYFVSYRTFNPVPDQHYFDHGFPRGARPYAITLRPDVPSPFRQQPRGFGDANGGEPKPKTSESKVSDDAAKAAGETADAPARIEIDFSGIRERVVPFPVDEGRYFGITATKRYVFYDVWPIRGAFAESGRTPPPNGASLRRFDLSELKEDTLAEGVTGFELSQDRSALMYRAESRLRVIDATQKPPEKDEGPGRASGWVDLSRPRVSVLPAAEWRQMYREAWRLQRDNFWTADMSGVDWLDVYERYLPVLERVATREELGDLLWEMQGELGTSHAYEMGGQRRPSPPHSPGSLAADFAWRDGAWHIEHIVRGDAWRPTGDSPLREPGVRAAEGQRIVAVDGTPLTEDTPPESRLVNLAGTDVELVIDDGGERRTVTVRTLRDDTSARYREWVEANRRHVHEASDGDLGYLHVPDMGAAGFAEFHRYYLAEFDKHGLIVDVRYNGGGNVSQLLLPKLATRRIGYDQPRHGRPVPYPSAARLGPLVCLTNEHAGSDGDIFSHCFKLLGLGPLIGKRTWGGVVGIWPRHALVDGTVTTQAEFAFWFEDVGFRVENYGTDPDIEVDVRPQDWVAGRDPQLETAIGVLRQQIAAKPAGLPDFGARPTRAAPRLA